MPYEGMDVDAVRVVAQRLTASAGQLDSIIGTIEGLVAQAFGAWDGQDVHDFQGWWTSQHRPKLQGLHQDLVGAATRLGQQMAQQEQVSGVGAAAHGAAEGSRSPGSSTVLGIAGLASGIGGWVSHGVTTAAKLGENRFSTGRYSESWRKVLTWGDSHRVGNLLRFKQSEVTHLLNHVEKPLHVASSVVGHVADGLNVFNIYEEATHGKGVDAVFDAIESVKVPWPFSIAASPWEEVGRAVGNSIHNPDYDWSARGWSQIAEANPVDWGKAIWETAKEGAYTQPLVNVVSGWLPW